MPLSGRVGFAGSTVCAVGLDRVIPRRTRERGRPRSGRARPGRGCRLRAAGRRRRPPLRADAARARPVAALGRGHLAPGDPAHGRGRRMAPAPVRERSLARRARPGRDVDRRRGRRRARRRGAPRGDAAPPLRRAAACRRRPNRAASLAGVALALLDSVGCGEPRRHLASARRRADRRHRGEAAGGGRRARAARLDAAPAARVPHVRLHPRRARAGAAPLRGRDPALRRQRGLGGSTARQRGAPRGAREGGAGGRRGDRRRRALRRGRGARAGRGHARALPRVRPREARSDLAAPPGVTAGPNDHNGARVKARFTILPLALALLATGSVGTSSGAETAGALARAFAIRVVVPGGGSSTPTISSPPSDAVAPGSGFSYTGSEGVAVTTGSYVASVQSESTGNPFANASAEVTNLSLFNGEVTASDIVAHAKSSAKPGAATGDLSGVGVSALVVDGQPAAATGRVTLGDWGYADVSVQSASRAPTTFHGSVTALDVHLPADHGGLPAGSEIQVGYAEASVQASTAPPPPPGQAKKSQQGAAGAHKAPTAKRAPEPAKPIPGVPQSTLPTRLPPDIHPKLSETPGGYVFPVLGVAKGTVFSVGWNDIGGNRLWLRDEQGNQFYYAHLSAYTPLAVNNAHVSAGGVLRFVGNTRDAEGTPYHPHFA